MSSKKSAPLSDAVILAVARLVDDAQTGTREPSHSEIEYQIGQARLVDGDPNTKPGHAPVGKMKRLRATLSWALEHDRSGGEQLVVKMIDLIRSRGGFRSSSPNYVGSEPIQNAIEAFRSEGYELSNEGHLYPLVLDGLSAEELTEVLLTYVRRAQRGAADAALLVGTGKDLLEAVAAHLVKERFGHDPGKESFPVLLEGAFSSVHMATPKDTELPGEPAIRRLERAMYKLGCALNTLRNKEGTGHGRPWLSSLSKSEARSAVQLMGCIAERLLSAHKERPR